MKERFDSNRERSFIEFIDKTNSERSEPFRMGSERSAHIADFSEDLRPFGPGVPCLAYVGAHNEPLAASRVSELELRVIRVATAEQLASICKPAPAGDYIVASYILTQTGVEF